MKAVLSLIGSTGAVATAAACDILTTGRPGFLPLAVLAAGACGAAAWAVAAHVLRRFGRRAAAPPGGRFVLLAVALAFALADAYAAALAPDTRPFLLPTTFLLMLAAALSGAANIAVLSEDRPS